MTTSLNYRKKKGKKKEKKTKTYSDETKQKQNQTKTSDWEQWNKTSDYKCSGEMKTSHKWLQLLHKRQRNKKITNWSQI